MRVLVLGATGALGRRVVPLLLSEGHWVTAGGRSPQRLSRLGTPFATVDLFDRDAVVGLVRGHDAVVNLATHVPGTGARAFLPGAWKEMDRVRREGSALVADAAIREGVERVVQESFALIYPDSADRWVTESVPARPGAYNRSVLDAEASARRVTEAGGVGVVLRFAMLYGGDDDAFTRDVLRYARRGWLPLLGRPEGYLSMVTHDDAARAVVAALEAPAGIYNVVDSDPIERRELARVLGAVLGVPAPRLPPRWVARLGGSLGETIARSLRLSNEALCTATGWTPVYRSGREGWPAAAEAITTGSGSGGVGSAVGAHAAE
jgi:nucleoside-diphosphate-sugar epimerase